MEKVDTDFVEGKVDPELYHQLRTKYEDKFYDRENETKEQKRERILKIIYGLDERLSFGHIDQETYYKLSGKYNKMLEELGPEEDEGYAYEENSDEEDNYGDIDLS